MVEMFLHDGRFNTKDIKSLQRYRRFKKKHSVSDLLLCDGLTIDPTVMNRKEGHSKRLFSVERPTRSAHKLWCYAIKCITSPDLKLCQPLGPLLVDPPSHRPWFSSDDKALLSLQLDDDSWAIYEPIRTTRSLQYEWSYSATDRPRHTLLASVETIKSRQRRHEPTPIAPRRVRLHSTCAPPPSATSTPSKFAGCLGSFPNQSLLTNFVYDGDREWIRRGLGLGTIQLVHDGSYTQKVDQTDCSAAFIIVCNASGHSARGTVAERSANADNYREEALGAMCGVLALRAASRRAYRCRECRAFCENLGIVKHASRPTTSLPEKQVQADVLCLIKHLIRELPFFVNYQHV